MDMFSALVCGGQAIEFALAVVKSLSELRHALKYGHGFLRDEQAGVLHLQEIILQLIPKDKASLDPGFQSHLESIGTAVTRLLRLLHQRRRLQVVILLVIRRAEVRDSFALLERKKTTLNLYLTARNTAAIASFTTRASTPSPIMSPHSHSSSYDEVCTSQPSPLTDSYRDPPQDGEKSSDLERVHTQHTKPELHLVNFDGKEALRQQHGSSPTTNWSCSNNKASKGGLQNIFKNLLGTRAVHKNNESHNHAIQVIGQPSIGRKPTSPLNSVATVTSGGEFYTDGNQAIDETTEQHLYAPDQPNTISSYIGNIANTGGKQNFGMDVCMDLPVAKSRRWRPSKR